MQQRFAAAFVDKELFDKTAASHLLQAGYAKSGSPGYLPGLPLRAGLKSNASAPATMHVLRGGMSLPQVRAKGSGFKGLGF